MKGERWFRMYDGVLNDPKAQRLGELFQPWVNLMCLASKNAKNGGVLPLMPEIAFALRMSEEEAGRIVAALTEKGLIDQTETGPMMHNWDTRQYTSDSSAERVAKHRERKKLLQAVTDTVTVTKERAANVIPIDQPPLDDFFEERYTKHPKKGDRGIAQAYMVELPGIDTPAGQAEFAAGHDAWLNSGAWAWKYGAAAPTFAKFILDKTWKYPPAVQSAEETPATRAARMAIERLKAKEKKEA